MQEWVRWGQPLPDKASLPPVEVPVKSWEIRWAGYGFCYALYSHSFKPEWDELTREAYVLKMRAGRWAFGGSSAGATDWNRPKYERIYRRARLRFARRANSARPPR